MGIRTETVIGAVPHTNGAGAHVLDTPLPEVDAPPPMDAPLPEVGTAGSVDWWPPPEVVASCSVAMHRLGAADLSCLGLTSARRREGRTTLALASAIVHSAELGRRTLLVELDLERPSLSERLRLDRSPGIAEFGRGQATAAECVQIVGEGLGILTAGTGAGSLEEVVSTRAVPRLLAELQKGWEMAVVDLPPVSSATVGRRLARVISPVALVVRAGSTQLAEVRAAAALLGPATPVILNAVHRSVPRWLAPSWAQ